MTKIKMTKEYSYKTANTPFARATNAVGGISAMAKILKKNRQQIWGWINIRPHRLTPKECRIIEFHTDGLITTRMLRPDFFDK